MRFDPLTDRSSVQLTDDFLNLLRTVLGVILLLLLGEPVLLVLVVESLITRDEHLLHFLLQLTSKTRINYAQLLVKSRCTFKIDIETVEPVRLKEE